MYSRIVKYKHKYKRRKKYVVFFVLFFIVIIIVILCCLLFRNNFKVNNFNANDKAVYEVINYGDQYEDNGLEVKYGNLFNNYKYKAKVTNLSKDIEIDTTKLTTYNLFYQAKYDNHTIKIKKVLKIEDIKGPEITVNNIEKINLCPHSLEYTLKYSAKDNYDGDVTDQVEEKLEDGYLILTVSDSHDNTTVKKIKTTITDVEAPIITLNGDDNISLLLNTTYNELGATAVDNCDGNISNNIKIESNVDISKAGNYQVIYKIIDGSGNENQIIRNVSVYAPVKTDEKIIYLTFDDGPYKYTEQLLDILKKYNVKATFFVTNQYPAYNYLLKRENDEGHTVAIHSYTHKYYDIYSSVDNYFQDLDNMNNLIYAKTGSKTNLVRLPGGSSNTLSRNYKEGIMTQITNELNKRGYIYFDWNCASGDAGNTTSTSVVVANVTKCMQSGKTLIVLQHDVKEFSVDAVENIIENGKRLGYTFKALDENSYTAHQKIAN